MALRFHMMTPRDGGAQRRLGDILGGRLAAANLLGRVQVAKLARRRTGRAVPIAASSRHHVRFDEGDGSDVDELIASFSTDLAQDDEADYIRSLVPVIREVFDGLSTQYRRDAFTLAGTADVRLIGKIRDALADAAQKGDTAQDFEAAVKKLTDDAGVAELNAFTLDTAFNTAMQKAYSLGRYEQMRSTGVTAVLPFWQYWTVGDDRVRPEHAVLDGFTARAEDPVWRKIYPPNGFNCRCSVIPIPANEADKDADEPGYARLPLLAQLKVPQPGFGKVF
jgi:SPP1 gp7 family putative phage head morphogenesis protein